MKHKKRDKYLQTLWSEAGDMVELHQELGQLAQRIEAIKRAKLAQERSAVKVRVHFSAAETILYAIH